ncbi:Uncharacterised protein [Klebsiella pneumoniae subsp. pneumoniae]|nr:Uncharacterised protein [Klebsiella pneumoniae subsp. pneumoniae]
MSRLQALYLREQGFSNVKAVSPVTGCYDAKGLSLMEGLFYYWQGSILAQGQRQVI